MNRRRFLSKAALAPVAVVAGAAAAAAAPAPFPFRGEWGQWQGVLVRRTDGSEVRALHSRYLYDRMPKVLFEEDDIDEATRQRMRELGPGPIVLNIAPAEKLARTVL
ncbi:MAG: hypothetical protein OXC08_16405 [Thiotrichales bacterium]|nr:hypothetical protein [Thiotrichales bacterium]